MANWEELPERILKPIACRLAIEDFLAFGGCAPHGSPLPPKRRWILVSDGASEYRIFNPLSRVSIELPALEKLHRESRLSAELDGLKRLWYGPVGSTGWRCPQALLCPGATRS
ncbi:hypothetical protein NL676_008707 [Syzygium grande]|nr:hypothetical protein NL676_008707 [Syzygium grande]